METEMKTQKINIMKNYMITEKQIKELAEEQFDKLQEETLYKDRNCVGAVNNEDYEINGEKFNISVDGFWEKCKWFDWTAKDDEGNILFKGDVCY